MENTAAEVERPDIIILVITLILVTVGTAMIYSSSSILAMERFKDAQFFLKKQVFFVVIGMGVMVLMTKLDYHYLKKWAYPGIILSIILPVILSIILPIILPIILSVILPIVLPIIPYIIPSIILPAILPVILPIIYPVILPIAVSAIVPIVFGTPPPASCVLYCLQNGQSRRRSAESYRLARGLCWIS